MELKQGRSAGPAVGAPRLLIVPYGIETKEMNNLTADDPLLIVPYGIETHLFPIIF